VTKKSRVSTHHAECWRTHPECAVAMVERLQNQILTLESDRDMYKQRWKNKNDQYNDMRKRRDELVAEAGHVVATVKSIAAKLAISVRIARTDQASDTVRILEEVEHALARLATIEQETTGRLSDGLRMRGNPRTAQRRLRAMPANPVGT
jgi:uncharacterized coiled-coil DUF342 family protein